MHLVTSSQFTHLLDSSDASLVRLAKDGSDEAFEELMRRSWDRSVGLAFCRLGNREDALEEVQWSYWKAYTHLKTFTEEAKFSTWVGRIVINRCIMRLRSRKRAKVSSFDSTPNAPEGLQVRDTHRWCDPEEQFGSHEISSLVRSELRCVPKLLRTAVELRHMKGLSLDEIGVQLGINVGAVKTRVSRGNKYLRDRMTRHLGQRGIASLAR